MIGQLRTVRYRGNLEYSFTVGLTASDKGWQAGSVNDGSGFQYLQGFNNLINFAGLQPNSPSSLPPFKTMRLSMNFGAGIVALAAGPKIWCPPVLLITLSNGKVFRISSDIRNVNDGTFMNMFGDVVNLSVPIWNDISSNVNLGVYFPQQTNDNLYVDNFDATTVNDALSMQFQFLTYTEEPYWFQRSQNYVNIPTPV